MIGMPRARDPEATMGARVGQTQASTIVFVVAVLAGLAVFCAALVSFEQYRVQIFSVATGIAATMLMGGVLLARQLRRRERAEAALLESRQELLHAQRVGRLGSWTMNFRNGEVALSEQACAILDMPAAMRFASAREALDRVIPPDERAEVERDLEHLRQNGAPRESERRLHTLAGKVKWVRSFSEATFDAQGKPELLRGTIQDITDIKEAELRLAQSERAYRLLSEHTRDLVSLHGLDWALLYISNSAKHVLGYEPGDLVGHNVLEFVHPSDQPAVSDRMNALGTLEIDEFRLELRFRRHDGTWLWLECLAVMVRDELGAPSHIHACSRDITRRHDAVEALRISEERFRRLIEFTSDWYWETDADYRFTIFSVAEDRYDDVVPASLGKRRWESPFNRASEAFWAAHKAQVAAREPFKDLIYEFVDPKTGAVREFSCISGEPFFDEHGEYLGYRGTGRYVTQQKRSELALARRTDELANANARLNSEARKRRDVERNVLIAIEKELARVGLELHDDLGQNLTGIALLVKGLEKRLTDQASSETEEARRILALVNDTIRQARLVSHGLSPHIIGPDGLVNALQQLAEDVNSLGNVTCKLVCDSEIHLADQHIARGLYRIAQEAVNNALKHSKARSIVVELGVQGDETRIAVLDNGIGIDLPEEESKDEISLHSIRYRANVINAKLTVSRRPTGGTEVAATIVDRQATGARENASV